MGIVLDQIITLLNTDTGHLMYNLVLSFSIAGALYLVIASGQRGFNASKIRSILGLSLLLGLRLLLFIASGLVWQGILDGAYWLPILDRLVNLLSLLLISWLWAFPEPSPRGDAAVIIIGLFLIVSVVFSGARISVQDYSGAFNKSLLDTACQIASIVILTLGIVILLIDRPDGWVLGLTMESLLFIGHVVYLAMPPDNYEYPYVVRLFQLAAYPFLLLLAQRLLQQDEMRDQSDMLSQLDSHAPLEESAMSASRMMVALDTLIDGVNPTRTCQRTSRALVELSGADICLILDPPGEDGRLLLRCAYDHPQGIYSDGGCLVSSEVPLLSSAIRLGLTRYLPSGSGVTDSRAIAQLINRTQIGASLYLPVLSSAGIPQQVMVLLNLKNERIWKPEEQSLFAAFCQFLVYFLQHSDKMNELSIKFDQSIEARRNAENQIRLSYEQNQKLRDQLAVLREDYDQKSTGLATTSVLVGAGLVTHEGYSTLQAEYDNLLIEFEELTRVSSEREQSFEAELRLALEEIANLSVSLTESENKVAILDSVVNNAPVSIQQLATIVKITQDIRQPLASIIGYADILLNDSSGGLEENQRKYLKRIQISSKQMTQSIEKLLTLATTNSDLTNLDKNIVDIARKIPIAFKACPSTSCRHPVKVTIDIPNVMAVSMNNVFFNMVPPYGVY